MKKKNQVFPNESVWDRIGSEWFPPLVFIAEGTTEELLSPIPEFTLNQIGGRAKKYLIAKTSIYISSKDSFCYFL